MAVAPSDNRVEALVVLYIIVTAVCRLHLFAVVATVSSLVTLIFSVVSLSSAVCMFCQIPLPVSVFSGLLVLLLILVA